MTTWLLTILLFCLNAQRGNGQGNGVFHCGPQNMTLTRSNQMLLLTWRDEPSCSALKDVLIYEMKVFIADRQEYNDTVVVTRDQIGLTHSWKFTLEVASECTNHSVQLRSRYNNQTSQWKEEKTTPGNRCPEKPYVYPRNRIYEVGSTATFYCVVPAGHSFIKMYLSRYNGVNMSTSRISNQTYALTLNLKEAPDKWIDVNCVTNNKIRNITYGASFLVGYPPGDHNLQCETRDLKTVECNWTVGRDTLPALRSQYYLQGRKCNTTKEGCWHKMPDEAGEMNWTLTAKNKFGTVTLYDRADMTRRVRMLAPKDLTASTVNSRNVSLKWSWTVNQYNQYNVTCQVKVIHGETSSTSNTSGVGLTAAVFTDLIPNWMYTVKVRCRTDSWRWGDWSTGVDFHTKGDVPDALDVWMQMKENQVVVVWKMPLPNQSHGEITEYEVTWEQYEIKVPPSEHNLTLHLDTNKEHNVMVTARNTNGSSPPSTITIPNIRPERTTVNTSWITGSNGSFMLSWTASPASSCGYIIDWCPTFRCKTVEWIKVPANTTNATILSKDFRDTQRYSLSIYACTEGAPVLHQRRQGYFREIACNDLKEIEEKLFSSLKFKPEKANAEISWELTHPSQQTAFIRGYTLYYWSNGSAEFNESTENPKATSLRAENLNITSYTFRVVAQTALGECVSESIVGTMNSLTDDLIKSIFIALILVLGVLTVTTIFCYRHWNCIKHKVYPPIPKPVLTDNWLTSAGEHTHHHPHLDLRSEPDVMDIPELHYKPGVPVNDYVSEVPFSFTQTPKGYCNQPLKKTTPPPLTSPPSALTLSPFRGVFPNLLYNLMPADYQVQEGTPAIQTPDGYQPQNRIETFNLNPIEDGPNSPMFCEPTYILLPQAPST